MSERKLYEQLIAEKLQQLPVPDADAGWQQMKRLLDEDETPRGGGKIPGPRGKWWWAGFAALLVSTGAVFYYHQGDDEVSKEQLAVNASNNNNSIAGKGNTQTAKVSATTPSNYNNNNQQNAGINNTSTLKSNSSNTSIAPKNNEAANNGAATATAVANKATVTPAVTNNRTNAGVYSAANNKPVTPTVKTNTHITVNKTKTNNSKTKNSYLKSTLSVAAVKSNNPSASKSNLGSSAKHSGTNVQTGISNLPPVDNDVDVLDEVLIQKQHQRIKLLQALTVNTLPAAPVSGMELNTIPAEKEAALHAVDEAAVAATMKKLKQAEKDLKKEERKERRAFNMEQVFKPFSLKADGEPWWAVGLALNAGITTGSQQRVNYNSSAKSSTVSDYLPSPYVQYHVNDNVFLQTEINLSMPQYTPRLLLFQNEMSNVSGNTLSKSVYVQKLYYFSWPVSLHYSPVKNLYFNGGLQFSSFQSGIALIQQSNQNNQVVKSDVLRFRDDSIAARLTPNEWRWQTGADYYMNRFTFGLRYNKSFKDLVNLQLNSSLPPTVARNNAFLFYMRYNLFDGRGSRNASANSSLVRW
ncbi:MAG: porin family protein [Flavihumibacter sp.]|nr:porin family protein [Flavihumibacter sp.]